MNKKEVIKGILFIIIFIIIFKICGIVESTNIKKGYVTNIEERLITIEDTQGKEWQYVTNKKLAINDKVSIVIDNNNTEDNEKDDIVKKVKKIK